MARYTMDDGTIVDTDKASQSWNEDTYWDGNNQISIPTGSQWDHQALHRSRKGRYYLEYFSNIAGRRPRAEWIGNHTAVKWLLANNHDDSIHGELKELIDEVSE